MSYATRVRTMSDPNDASVLHAVHHDLVADLGLKLREFP